MMLIIALAVAIWILLVVFLTIYINHKVEKDIKELDEIEKEIGEEMDEMPGYYPDHSAEYRQERYLRRLFSETSLEPSGMENLGAEEKLHMRSEFPPD